MAAINWPVYAAFFKRRRRCDSDARESQNEKNKFKHGDAVGIRDSRATASVKVEVRDEEC